MRMKHLHVNGPAGKRKAPAWTAALLLVVLIGLVALIVTQLRGRRAGETKPKEYTSALQKIDKSIADLKRRIEDKKPLQIVETLANRPPAEAQPAPATQTTAVAETPKAAVTTPPTAPEQPAAAPPPAAAVAVAPEVTPAVPPESLVRRVTPVREPAQPLEKKASEPPPDLKGIFWSTSNPLALVNGAVVGLGESVGGRKVVDIQTDRVTFEDEKGTRLTVPLYKE
jgi:hypothetical protein